MTYCAIKPRHVAALALVGWYLMLPPFCGSVAERDAGRKCTEEELNRTINSEWDRMYTFDTAEECNAQFALMLHDYGKAKATGNLAPGVAVPKNVDFGPLLHAKCISADDPRLKEK